MVAKRVKVFCNCDNVPLVHLKERMTKLYILTRGPVNNICALDDGPSARPAPWDPVQSGTLWRCLPCQL